MSADLPVRGSVVLLTRRRSLAGLMAATGACVGRMFGLFLAAVSSRRPAPAARRSAGAGDRRSAPARSGRAHSAALGRRQCRRRRPGDAQRRRNGAGANSMSPNIQLLVKDDAGTADGARHGRAAGGRRRLRTDPRPAVRAGREHRRPGGALAQHSGDRLFHRLQRGVARHLFAQLPARDRCRAHRAICRLGREAFLRGAHSRQSLWNGGRGGVPAGRRPARRSVGRARALFA